MTSRLTMYLVDTNVISELYRGARGNPGVRAFAVAHMHERFFLSALTVGELRRGIELLRYRGNRARAESLQTWFERVLVGFRERILDVDAEIAQLWACLRVPHGENALDKLIAATALVYGLTVVTRNERHFVGTGVKVLNPFE
ncbi:MAG: type II toxin-antitoxin system VapC family toxin [Gammaproteobacteria bacterium]